MYINIIFNDKNFYLTSENNYNSLFIETLFVCKENKNINIDKDSYIFEKYILEWEHSKNENYEKYLITEDSFFEFIFQELGYFGCIEQIKYMKKIYEIVKDKRNLNSRDYEDLISSLNNTIYIEDYLTNPNTNFENIKKFFLNDRISKNQNYLEYIILKLNLDFNQIQQLTNNKYLLIKHTSVDIKFIQDNIVFFKDNIKSFISLKHIPLELYIKNNLLTSNLFYILLLNRDDIDQKFIEIYISIFENDYPTRCWSLISEKANIDVNFVKKYKKNINFRLLSSNPFISDEILKEFRLDIYDNIISLNISQDMFLFNFCNIDLFKKFKFSSNFLKQIDHEFINDEWDKICENKNINEDVFQYRIENFKYINWYFLCKNINISESFFEKYINMVNWVCLSENTNISESFFEKYIENIYWESLTKNTNISSYFFDKYYRIFQYNYNCWKNLSNNSNMDVWFFIKHLDVFKIFDINLIRNPLRYGKK